MTDELGVLRSTLEAAVAAAAAVGVESVVLVEGTVVLRSADTRNPEMATGDVEVRATAIRVVGPAVTPAIPVALLPVAAMMPVVWVPCGGQVVLHGLLSG